MATLIHGVKVEKWFKQGGHTETHVFLGADGFIYKQCPKYNAQNEYYALNELKGTGFVPKCEWIFPEVLKLEFIKANEITDPGYFRAMCSEFLEVLRIRNLRHGDLTKYSVLPRDNMPVVIDWAESRIMHDPRPDKRKGGDKANMEKTMELLIAANSES
jgi:RIO-like serine/threonine protein kinase